MTFKYCFDSKCYDLAEHFLPSESTTQAKNELAQTIQDAVEDFCMMRSGPKCEACNGSGGDKGYLFPCGECFGTGKAREQSQPIKPLASERPGPVSDERAERIAYHGQVMQMADNVMARAGFKKDPK